MKLSLSKMLNGEKWGLYSTGEYDANVFGDDTKDVDSEW